MKGGNHRAPVETIDLAAHAADRVALGDSGQLAHRMPPERNDHFRVEDLELLVEERHARSDLLRKRIAVFGGRHLTMLAMNTSSRRNPMPLSMILVRSCPARPTNGRPISSSVAPGPSPIKTTRALGFPRRGRRFASAAEAAQLARPKLSRQPPRAPRPAPSAIVGIRPARSGATGACRRLGWR